MHKQKHTRWLLTENRLLHFSLGLHGDNADNLRRKIEQQKKKDAKEDETIERADVDELIGQANADVNTYLKKIDHLPAEFQDQFNTGLAEYMGTSLTRFDKDTDGLEKKEFEEYTDAMRESISEIAKKHQEVEEDEKKKAEDQAERTRKSFEEELQDLNKPLEELTDSLDLNETMIENIDNPDQVLLVLDERMMAELQKYDERARELQSLQQSVAEQYQDINDVKQAYLAETAAGGVNTVGATSAIAAGAAIGTFVPIPGIGTGLGALIGAAVWAMGRGAYYAAMQREWARMRGKAQQKINKKKQQFEAAAQEVGEQTEDMQSDGEVLNEAPEKVRKVVLDQFEKRKKQLDRKHIGVRTAQRDADQRMTEFATAMGTLNEQQIQILDHQYLLDVRQQEMQTKKEQVAIKNQDLMAGAANVEEALRVIANQMRLAPKDKQESLRVKEQELLQVKDQLQQGIDQTVTAEQQQTLAGEQLEQAKMNAVASQKSLATHKDMMTQAQEHVASAIATLNEQRDALIATNVQLVEEKSEQLESLTSVDEAIASSVFNTGLENTIVLDAINDTVKATREVKIEEPGFYRVIIGDTATGFGKGFKAVFGTIATGLESIGHGLEYIGGENWVTGALAAPTNFLAGASEAFGELGHGIGMLVANPTEAAKGIGSLLTFGITENSRKAWSAMGSFMFAAEEIENYDFSKAAGKILVNIGLIFTPGAPAQGARMAALAFTTAKGGSVLSKLVRGTGKAAWYGTVETVRGLAGGVGKAFRFTISAPGNVLKGLWNLPSVLRAPGTAWRNWKLHRNSQALAETSNQLTAQLKLLDDMGIQLTMEQLQAMSQLKPWQWAEHLGLNGSGKMTGLHEIVQVQKLFSLRQRLLATREKFLASQVADDLAHQKQPDHPAQQLFQAIDEDAAMIKTLQERLRAKSKPGANRLVDRALNGEKIMPTEIADELAALTKKFNQRPTPTLQRQINVLRELERLHSRVTSVIQKRVQITDKIKAQPGEILTATRMVDGVPTPVRCQFVGIDAGGRVILKFKDGVRHIGPEKIRAWRIPQANAAPVRYGLKPPRLIIGRTVNAVTNAYERFRGYMKGKKSPAAKAEKATEAASAATDAATPAVAEGAAVAAEATTQAAAATGAIEGISTFIYRWLPEKWKDAWKARVFKNGKKGRKRKKAPKKKAPTVRERVWEWIKKKRESWNRNPDGSLKFREGDTIQYVADSADDLMYRTPDGNTAPLPTGQYTFGPYESPLSKTGMGDIYLQLIGKDGTIYRVRVRRPGTVPSQLKPKSAKPKPKPNKPQRVEVRRVEETLPPEEAIVQGMNIEIPEGVLFTTESGQMIAAGQYSVSSINSNGVVTMLHVVDGTVVRVGYQAIKNAKLAIPKWAPGGPNASALTFGTSETISTITNGVNVKHGIYKLVAIDEAGIAEIVNVATGDKYAVPITQLNKMKPATGSGGGLSKAAA